jgi:hypothetical protein
MSKRQSNNIEVTVRVRPLHRRKKNNPSSAQHTVPSSVKSFSYPSAVVVGEDQTVSFEAIGLPLLQRMNQGYNTTLLAYGQTGSGKTYTVFGPHGSLTEASLHGPTTASGAPIQWGIFPRIALAMVDSTSNLKASAIEIYNNTPFDLLNGKKSLQVSQSKNAAPAVSVRSKAAPEGGSKFNNYKTGLNGEHPPGCYCRICFKAKEEAKEAQKSKRSGSRSQPVAKTSTNQRRSGGRTRVKQTETRTVGETLWDLKTSEDVAKFARQIESSRVAHGHALIDRSSRSHCLVRLQSTSISSDGTLRKNCFTFVDLAGSERISKSNVEGQRKSEAITINGSLTVLGRCIRAVGKGDRHVPWRDTVLCQLLRTSFEGQSATHTSVIVNVAHEPEHEDETLCTLRFGETVSCVTNKATVVVGQNAAREMGTLKEEVRCLRSKKKAMDRAGQGPGFVKGCINSEKVSLQANMDRLVILQNNLADLKVRLVETRSDAQRSKIAKRIEAAAKEVENHGALVYREQTIKALWHEATPMYKALIAELDERENQLRMVMGK